MVEGQTDAVVAEVGEEAEGVVETEVGEPVRAVPETEGDAGAPSRAVGVLGAVCSCRAGGDCGLM
ncbi:hypothetical protein R2F25_06065 [Streptomyces sp. UP1A-1]|nr:hypothetical protein [Streptomyces sp. UP1A-1]